MKIPGKLLYGLGSALFFIGILVSLGLLGGLVWPDLEASFYFGYDIQGEQSLRVNCPLLMTAAETGVVTVTFSNPTDRQAKPLVEVNLSGPLITTSQTRLTLEPGEKQTLQWEISAENRDFRYLILVRVFQYLSYPLPSADGFCGTLFLPLQGLSGRQLFGIFLGICFLTVAGGISLTAVAGRILERERPVETGSMVLLSLFIFGGILAAIFNQWGVGLLVIVFSVLLTIILLSRRIAGL